MPIGILGAYIMGDDFEEMGDMDDCEGDGGRPSDNRFKAKDYGSNPTVYSM